MIPKNNNLPSITPFIISRKCNLSLIELHQLRNRNLFLSIKKLDRIQRRKDKLAKILIEKLQKLVPLAESNDRNMLINLKRNLYNKKDISSSQFLLFKKYCKNNDINEVNLFESLNQEIKKIDQKNNLLYEEYQSRSRKFIVDLCSNEFFLKSIQLSSERLLNKITEYKFAIQKNNFITKRLRQTEETLLSYFYRMLLKPSPFASFSSVITHLEKSYTSKTNFESKYHFCMLPRTLIQWLGAQCLSHKTFINKIPIRINSTIIKNDKEITFFRRPDENSKNIYGGEQYLRIKNSEIISKIIFLLNKKELNKLDLITLLSKSYKKEELAIYIEELIKIGFLERKLPIPDLTIRYAKKISSIISQLNDETLNSLTQKFNELNRMEVTYQKASISDRIILLNNIKRCVMETVDLLKVQDPGINHIRNYIYEDVGEVCGDIEDQVNEFGKYRNDISIVYKLLPLFDEAIVERLSLYNYFKQLYGNNNNSIPLMNFYNEFAKLDVHQVTQVMKGTFSLEVKKIKELRLTWFKMLSAVLKNHSSKNTLFIDSNWLSRFTDTFPDFMRGTKSSIFYLQNSNLPNIEALIINGVSTGYGAFFSRFCSIYGKHSKIIRKAVRKALQVDFNIKNMFDLTAVLGVNTNLHPVLFKNFIEYPGCISFKSPISERIYRLNDLVIKADNNRHQLILTHQDSQEEILFIPLNFLLPAIGPSLYRFLYLFSPYINFKGGLWKSYLEFINEEDKVKILPRLQTGNIILDRKTWIFPPKFIPKYSIDKEDSIGFLSELSNWQKEMSFPDFVFYRQQDKKTDYDNWVLAMKGYMQFYHKTKTRKPHFLDFKNPLLLKIFLKHTMGNNNKLVIQECLPLLNLKNIQKNSCMEEFLVQFNF